MMSTFDSVDRDLSGELSLDEIYMIFKEIGFDSPEDVNACLTPMLKKIPKSMVEKYPPLPPQPPPKREGGCGGEKAPPVVPQKPEFTISKAIFLAWFLHLEKQGQGQTP